MAFLSFNRGGREGNNTCMDVCFLRFELMVIRGWGWGGGGDDRVVHNMKGEREGVYIHMLGGE